MNQYKTKAQDNNAVEKNKRLLGSIGKSQQMLFLSISTGLITLSYLLITIHLYIYPQEFISMVKELTMYISITESICSKLTIIFGIITAIRAIPFTACIIIYVKSKNHASLNSIKSPFILIKLFSLIEGLVWFSVAIICVFKFFSGTAGLFAVSSRQFSILIFSTLFMLFKTIQSFSLFIFTIRTTEAAKNGNLPIAGFSTLNFSSFMLIHLFLIAFIELVVSLIHYSIAVHNNILFSSFQYIWPIYLFIIGYMLSNFFLYNAALLFKKQYEKNLNNTMNHTLNQNTANKYFGYDSHPHENHCANNTKPNTSNYNSQKSFNENTSSEIKSSNYDKFGGFSFNEHNND